MTRRLTRKAWKALTEKHQGQHHDRNKCGVCSRPNGKRIEAARIRRLKVNEEEV